MYYKNRYSLNLKREKTMVQINYNLKARRKNMRCAKFECDMAKAFAGAFQDIIEDNKRMKDALILFFALS